MKTKKEKFVECFAQSKERHTHAKESTKIKREREMEKKQKTRLFKIEKERKSD